MKEIAWECSCGNIEYGALPPEDCPNCFKINSFTQLPEELIEEREKDRIEEDLEIFYIKKSSSARKKTKTKTKKVIKKTKGGRRKK